MSTDGEFDEVLDAMKRSAEIEAENILRIGENHGKLSDLTIARVSALRASQVADMAALLEAAKGNPT